MGIWKGGGAATDEIARLLENIKDPHRHGKGKVVFSESPKELVSELVELIKKEHQNPEEAERVGD